MCKEAQGLEEVWGLGTRVHSSTRQGERKPRQGFGTPERIPQPYPHRSSGGSMGGRGRTTRPEARTTAPRCRRSPPTEMCSGFEAGSCLRLRDFVYHSTLGLSVTKMKFGDVLFIELRSGSHIGTGMLHVTAPAEPERFRLDMKAAVERIQNI